MLPLTRSDQQKHHLPLVSKLTNQPRWKLVGRLELLSWDRCSEVQTIICHIYRRGRNQVKAVCWHWLLAAVFFFKTLVISLTNEAALHYRDVTLFTMLDGFLADTNKSAWGRNHQSAFKEKKEKEAPAAAQVSGDGVMWPNCTNKAQFSYWNFDCDSPLIASCGEE